MKEQIEGRFRNNLRRVRRLWTMGSDGDGDVLRAAIVLLHAALEDLVRSVLSLRLPSGEPQGLVDIPLVGHRANSHKFTLRDLAAHRGKTVDALIHESVVEHLELSSFSDPSQISGALTRAGILVGPIRPHQTYLAAMMKRRHWIVHRADQQVESGNPVELRPIAPPDVEPMIRSVEAVADALMEQLS